jgi:hypothetical protein
MYDNLDKDASTMTVRVPLAIKKRGGRKMVISPVGLPSWVPSRQRIDSTIVKAIARAFRWRKLLEDGTHATVEEIASAEKINFLCQPSPTANSTRPQYRRGHSGWAAALGDDRGHVNEAVPVGMAEAGEGVQLSTQCNVALAQQCLNFLPDPHGHSSFRRTFGASRRKVVAKPRRPAPNTRSASK